MRIPTYEVETLLLGCCIHLGLCSQLCFKSFNFHLTVLLVLSFNILGNYARTKEGEKWVWQFREHVEAEDDEDVTEEDLQVIIFATMGNLKHLGRANIWYGDGTFSVCPVYFINCTPSMLRYMVRLCY